MYKQGANQKTIGSEHACSRSMGLVMERLMPLDAVQETPARARPWAAGSRGNTKAAGGIEDHGLVSFAQTLDPI